MGQRATLLLILALALAARLGWGLTRGTSDDDLKPLPDQSEYLQIARNWTGGRGMVLFDARFGQSVHAYRTPGYPAFIAALGSSIRAVRVAQALIDTSTVLAAFLLARRLCSARAGLAAAAFVAFSPFLIYFSGLLLTETLYTAMLAWGIVLTSRDREGAGEEPLADARGSFGGWARWLTGVALLALGALVRPSGVGLTVVLAAASVLLNRQHWPAYHWVLRMTLGGLVAALICAAALLPWAWRNAHHPQLGGWIWTTTNGGITLYDGLHDSADGSSDQDKFVPQMRPTLSKMTEMERDDFLRQQAWQWAGDHPGRTIVLAGKKMLRTWSPMPLSTQFGRPAYVAVGLLYAVPVWLLVVVGLCSRTLSPAAKMVLLLPAVYFTALTAVSVGSLRYRLPADVPMTIVAAAALAKWPSRSA